MKYWEAEILGLKIRAVTLKELAAKLDIKPSLIEGVYYRNRLSDTIKIHKVTTEESLSRVKIVHGDFALRFD